MYQEMINELTTKGNYQNYEIDLICEMLQKADDEYTNDGDLSSFEMTDSQYDVIRFNAQKISPSHIYFTGIGSEVRGEKVLLPNKMTSLDQIEIGGIKKWISNSQLKNEVMISSDKMDGTSLQLIYNVDGSLRIAYSRGDGIRGSDVTRHIKKMKLAQTQIQNNTGQIVEVRCEVELSNSAFQKIKKVGNRVYKNPRNMVAGMMNKEEAVDAFYQNVDVFAYELLNTDLSKSDSLQLMNEMNLNVVHWKSFKASELNEDELAEYLTERKNNLDYDIDGLVLSVDSVEKRLSMDAGLSNSSNPKSSIKYKVADSSNYAKTTVKFVEWNDSKHGCGNPTIHLVPFELQGVTISKTTGFNAAYIKKNKIGPDAEVLMTRSGDVIPYIVEITKPAHDWQKPENYDDYEWNETKVDLFLKQENDEVKIQRIISFCTSLDLPQLKEGSIRKLYKNGYCEAADILLMPKSTFIAYIGENGKKIYDGIHNKFSDIKFSDLIGSTHYFGSGLGKRKFEELFVAKDWELMEDGSVDLTQFDLNNLILAEGFSDKTAQKVLNGRDDFIEFYNKIAHIVTIQKSKEIMSGGKFENEIVVFTGYRDKEAQEKIKEMGGTIGSSVSGKTTLVVTSDPNGTSSKIKKARDKGIKIVGPDELMEMFL